MEVHPLLKALLARAALGDNPLGCYMHAHCMALFVWFIMVSFCLRLCQLCTLDHSCDQSSVLATLIWWQDL